MLNKQASKLNQTKTPRAPPLGVPNHARAVKKLFGFLIVYVMPCHVGGMSGGERGVVY